MDNRHPQRPALKPIKFSSSTPAAELSGEGSRYGDSWEDVQESYPEAGANILEESELNMFRSPVSEIPKPNSMNSRYRTPRRVSRKTGRSTYLGRQTFYEPLTRAPRQRQMFREPTTDSEAGDKKVKQKPAKPVLTNAWNECNQRLKDHDGPMVDGWKEEIDGLLTFAGLFSAALTAFIVESYTFLQPDPQGTSSNILREILLELRNSSQQPAESVQAQYPFISPTPSSFAIRVNVMWFSSLVLSLSAASVGILVKQWLREYSSHTGISARDSARIRQLRHNALKKWHVPDVVAALPVLLQWSLGLFFIGLIDLLWSLNDVVAGIVMVFVCLSLFFLVSTTVLPAFCADSPHCSPQSLAFYFAYEAITRLLAWVAAKSINMSGLGKSPMDPSSLPLRYEDETTTIHPLPDTAIFTYFSGWWAVLRVRLFNFEESLRRFASKRTYASWREREIHVVQTKEAAHLDYQILANVDALFMDDEILKKVIKPCIEDPDTEPSAAVSCLLDIYARRADGTEDGLPTWRESDVLESGVVTQLHLIVGVLRRSYNDSEVDHDRVMKILRILDRLCRAIPFKVEHKDTTELYEQVYEVTSQLLSFNETRRDAFDLLLALLPRANVHVRVSAIAIQNILKFAESSKQNNDSERYLHACLMALQFGAELPREDLRELELGALLPQALEDLLEYSSISGINALPSPSLRTSLSTFAQRNGKPVYPEIIKVLDRFAAAGTVQRPLKENDEQAIRTLRRWFTTRRPNRQTGVLPVYRLEDLDLRYHELPQEESMSEGSVFREKKGISEKS